MLRYFNVCPLHKLLQDMYLKSPSLYHFIILDLTSHVQVFVFPDMTLNTKPTLHLYLSVPHMVWVTLTVEANHHSICLTFCVLQKFTVKA